MKLTMDDVIHLSLTKIDTRGAQIHLVLTALSAVLCCPLNSKKVKCVWRVCIDITSDMMTPPCMLTGGCQEKVRLKNNMENKHDLKKKKKRSVKRVDVEMLIFHVYTYTVSSLTPVK